MEINFEYQGEIYTYVIHQFDPTYDLRDSQNGTAMNARRRPDELTDDWLAEELFRGMLRDLQTSRANDQSFVEALEDATSMIKGECLVVFNDDNIFVGKINFFLDNITRTINVMGLYAPSGRHRIRGLSYASLIWHIISSMAMTTFGQSALVLMPYPRDIIYQRLLNMTCNMVHVTTVNGNLLTSRASMIRWQRNNMMIRVIMQQIIDDTYDRDDSDDDSISVNDIIVEFFEARGALFMAKDLINN